MARQVYTQEVCRDLILKSREKARKEFFEARKKSPHNSVSKKLSKMFGSELGVEDSSAGQTPLSSPSGRRGTMGSALATPQALHDHLDRNRVDRDGIERNAFGEEEPHGYDPELWNIDGTEIDLLAKYKTGGQMWYLQCRAIEAGVVSGVPMNRKARENKKRAYILPGTPPMPDGATEKYGSRDAASSKSGSSSPRRRKQHHRHSIFHHGPDAHWTHVSEGEMMTMRRRLQVYLPIEKLHFVLEMVPPPLGVKTRNTSQATMDMRIARIIMNLHTNIHSTPLADTSVEVSLLCPFVSRFVYIAHTLKLMIKLPSLPHTSRLKPWSLLRPASLILRP